jgi:hypothetical protein
MSPLDIYPSMICLCRPSLYPWNGALLRMKIRPRLLAPSMRWSCSSNNTTSQVTGERPAVAAVGSLVLGPVGLVGGALAGGNKKRITFTLTLKDGRRMLAAADGKTWTKLQSALF